MGGGLRLDQGEERGDVGGVEGADWARQLVGGAEGKPGRLSMAK